MAKVTIVGSGNVGATAAFYAAERNLADVAMVDIAPGMPQAKSLDAQHCAPLRQYHVNIVGSNDYAAMKDSDVVIVTAGLPRKPGMSREDLVNINAKIVASVSKAIAEYAPNAKVIIVSNPLDIMTYVAWKATGFGVRRVMGMAGVLDSARLRYFIAEELNVSPSEVQALVLGGHGDEMVPLPEYSTVDGIPVTELIAPERLEQIFDRTRKGGGEIVNYLKTGSAFYAPAASSVEMAECILRDNRRILPVAAYLQGEYGIKGYFIGVPALLGKNGVEKVIEIPISDEGKAQLKKSARLIEETIAKLEIPL
ncbi:MAG: malate dehydrogenase [Myxococcales bacterium]|nr:MAG: malate dehydrogenase [Myxococcales bacterium]